jgi:hypothetical protein
MLNLHNATLEPLHTMSLGDIPLNRLNTDWLTTRCLVNFVQIVLRQIVSQKSPALDVALQT